MAENQEKEIFTLDELAIFTKWAKEQEEKGEKITFRAVKAAMKCGQIKAEALRRQYEDDKTRAVIEVAQQAELPESVLNALSEYLNGQIKAIANQVHAQIQAAESRAEEMAQVIENAESTAQNAAAELTQQRELAIAYKARLDVLEKEHAENKAALEKITAECNQAKIEAAAAKAALQTFEQLVPRVQVAK